MIFNLRLIDEREAVCPKVIAMPIPDGDSVEKSHTLGKGREANLEISKERRDADKSTGALWQCRDEGGAGWG